MLAKSPCLPSQFAFTFCCVGLLSLSLTQSSWGQSGTTGSGTIIQRTPVQQPPIVQQAPMGSQSGGSSSMGGSVTAGSGMSGSGARIASPNLPIAMNGFCPVCIIDMRKWMRGSPNFAADIDGKRYLFPGEQQRQKFLQNVAQYTPALGGDCIVCYVDGGGVRTPGSVYHTAIHKNRLYLFPGADEKAKFMANPAKYENADLAAGGMCTVCRVEMQQQVPGKPEFNMIYKGKRYFFPGQDQRKMFLANPAKYEDR